MTSIAFLEDPTSPAPQLTRPKTWWRPARTARWAASNDDQESLSPELLTSLRRPLAPASVPYVVATTSLKGGVGKTTVSACTGLMLARHRADRVLAADLNLHAGTLSNRLIEGPPRATVQHLLDDLLDEDTPVSAVGDIDRYIDVADRLSVLAGHTDPTAGAAFAQGDVFELMACLGMFFHIIVADCGTGIADEAMQAVLREADTLILVATPTPDSAGLAEATLTWLDSHGYSRLAANSIAVLSGAPSNRQTGLHDNFYDRCRTVIDIPPDPQLAQGRLITLESLAYDTRCAYMALAAAVIEAAPDHTRTGPK